MSHTPAPWTIPNGSPVQIIAPGLCDICTMSGASSNESVMADARLIASAPDLLAALQRLIATDDAHSTIHAPDGDDVARMIEYAAAFDDAREVVAKATGADK